MKKITREEFREKYRDAVVKFSSYYKYTFYYKGNFEGGQVRMSIGGDAGEIYRLDVSANDQFNVGETIGMWDSGEFYNKDNKEVEYF